MKFQVITLESTPERYAQFLSRNPFKPFKFEKFSAIDGNHLNIEHFKAAGSIVGDPNYTLGAYGCAFSHLSLWERCSVQEEVFHIAEDDAVFRSDLAKHITSTMKKFPNFDLLYWGYNRDLNFAMQFPGFGEVTALFNESSICTEDDLIHFQNNHLPFIFPKVGRVFGTLCYSVSPKGARKLLSTYYPIQPVFKSVNWSDGLGRNQNYHFENVGVDVATGVILADQYDSYAAFPPLAVSLGTLGLPSQTQRS